MKISPIDPEFNRPDFLKATQIAIDNGHIITENLLESDLIILGPKLGKRVAVIGIRPVEIYTNYNNWVYRTFWV